MPSGRVVIVGQGYVGLPLAMRAADVGFDVLGYEIDGDRLDMLKAGRSFVGDVSDDELSTHIGSGRYRASDLAEDCAGFDVAVITVPTPLREGVPDLTFIEDAARLLGPFIRTGVTVVLESTTYPGTTTELVAPILGNLSGLVPGEHFHLGHSPERIDPGNATWNLINTPKVVSGVNLASLLAVKEFYDQLCERTVPVTSPSVAELSKLIENTFRHVNIALVNELAMFANQLDVDVWEAIDAASSKPFGFMAFRPGPGVGGHCLPIDPSYLSWKVRRVLGQSFRFVELANDVNEHMPDHVVQRVMLGLNRHGRAVRGSHVLVLGIAYKPNTSDARESPALAVIDRLVQLGATVRVADPHVGRVTLDPRVERVDATEAEAARADIVVLITDHDDFDLEAISRSGTFIFDTRNRIAGGNVEFL